jgi:hypothetical protein
MISDILIVLSLILFWALVGFVCFRAFPCPEHLLPENTGKKRTKAYFNYYGNYVSILHAFATFGLTLYLILTEGVTIGQDNTSLGSFVLYNSLSYFIYDTLISEYYRYNTLPMTFHHLTTLGVVGFAVVLQKGANEVGIALLCAEISNPFNLAREILKHYKMENTKLFFLTSVTFASLYTVTRFIFVPLHMKIMYPGSTHIGIKLLAATVWFISWHWLFVIINLLCKEVRDFLKKYESKSNFWGGLYSFVTQLRKNKIFMAAFYATAAFLSYGTLYMVHPRDQVTA